MVTIEDLNNKIQSIEDKNTTLKHLIEQANNPTEKEDIIRNNLNMKRRKSLNAVTTTA